MLANATLTEIHDPGPVDRSGKRQGDGNLVWSGMLRCYLRRASKMVTVGGNLNRVEFDQLVIRGRIPASIGIGSDFAGSVLTVSDERDGTIIRKFRAAGIEKLAAGTAVDSVRIELADERLA